ncbi:MAG TPA: hypothetical protein PLD51_08565, partial [Pontiellaceae bacterium]|nr:hypothetical protein [Pontiellaceae bacterium]
MNRRKQNPRALSGAVNMLLMGGVFILSGWMLPLTAQTNEVFRWTDPYGAVLRVATAPQEADYWATTMDGSVFNPIYTNLINTLQHDLITGSVAGTAAQSNNLVYSIVQGPSWLTMSPDGTFSGTPDETILIYNNWIIAATSSNGLVETLTLRMTVENVNDPPRFSTNTIVLSAIAEGVS